MFIDNEKMCVQHVMYYSCTPGNLLYNLARLVHTDNFCLEIQRRSMLFLTNGSTPISNRNSFATKNKCRVVLHGSASRTYIVVTCNEACMQSKRSRNCCLGVSFYKHCSKIISYFKAQ